MVTRNASSMPVLSSEWEARGYHGHGNVQELIGSIAGRSAIVCGNGAGVFEELDMARAALEEPVIFGVNDCAMYLPKLDHFVSLHTDNLNAWRAVRWLNCQNIEVTKYHGVDARPGVDYVWDRLTPCFALSGYFAMQLAWVMGADRIVLCGCPGDQARRFFEWYPRADFGYGNHGSDTDKGVRDQLEHEMQRLPEFKAAVRSMSGWTASYFGSLEREVVHG
jgi:hypothetical protein